MITRNLTAFGDGAFHPYASSPVYVPVSLLGFAHGTKEFIPGLDLYLFGRRFYDPKTGRFVNRDPIGEDGGLNLYRFFSNNPLNLWDYDGMYSVDSGTSREVDGSGYGKTIELPAMVVYGTKARKPAVHGTLGDIVGVHFNPTPAISSPSGSAPDPEAPNNAEEKWSIEKCSNPWDQIQGNNNMFESYSNDLRDLLAFQQEADWTLFWVDRARDTAFSLAGNQFTKSIAALRAAQLEAQTSQLAKDLVAGGLVSGTSTMYGKIVSYAAGPLVDKGINGVASFFGKQPFTAGMNNVRNQIQDTVNSLESQTQDLAGTLMSQRETYRKHCQ